MLDSLEERVDGSVSWWANLSGSLGYVKFCFPFSNRSSDCLSSSMQQALGLRAARGALDLGCGEVGPSSTLFF